MNSNHKESLGQRWRNKALIYALIYLALASLWILFSGKALYLLVDSAELRGTLEIYKGWLFVLLTSLALYALLRTWQNEYTDHSSQDRDQTSKNDSTVSKIQLPAAYYIGLMLIVAAGGYLEIENLKSNQTQRIELNLSTVATLKAEQINGWLRHNANFAAAAGNGSHLASSFADWTSDGKLHKQKAEWIRTRLDLLRQSYPYGEITLFDLSGHAYMTTGEKPPDVADHLPTLLQQAVDSRQPVFGQMHWHDKPDGTRTVSLPMAAPLLTSGVGGVASGVLLFELNPEKNLFPIIESWLTPSQSLETILFRRDGDDVMFLSAQRNQNGTALTKVEIEANPTLLSVQAAKGKVGIISGTDYRGMSVTGYVVKIPGTDWLIATKIDTDEIEHPVRQLAINIALTALLLALVGSLSLFFWWRQRRARYESAQLKAELHQQALINQVDYLSKYANDIILLMDENGLIIDANDRAQAAYGYAHYELVGRSIRDLRSIEEQSNFDEYWQEVKQQKSMIIESLHRRRDGRSFSVEVSTRLIESENETFVQSIIRDISERKNAEAALRISEARFRRIAEEAPLPMIVYAEGGDILQVNHMWTVISGYTHADIPTLCSPAMAVS